MPSEGYQNGLAMLRQVDGKDGEAVVESLKDIAPDFARYLIEFPFGDIYARPGLDLKSREIAVIAALTALGNTAPQLKKCISAPRCMLAAHGRKFWRSSCRWPFTLDSRLL